MAAKPHQAAGGQHFVENTGSGARDRAERKLMPADRARRFLIDQAFDARPDHGARIGDHGFHLGMRARHRGGNPRKVRDLMGRIVIEEEHHPHRATL